MAQTIFHHGWIIHLISNLAGVFVLLTRYLVIQKSTWNRKKNTTSFKWNKLWEKIIQNSMPLLFLRGKVAETVRFESDSYDPCRGKKPFERLPLSLWSKEMWRQVISKIQENRQKFHENSWANGTSTQFRVFSMLDRFQDHVNVSSSQPSSPSGQFGRFFWSRNPSMLKHQWPKIPFEQRENTHTLVLFHPISSTFGS